MLKISLPMYRVGYDTAAAKWLEGLKRHLKAAGVTAPVTIVEDPAPDLPGHWRDPDLLLSQTCGYPYARYLRNHVTVVATPAYAVPGFRPGYYNSRILVNRQNDCAGVAGLRGAVVAINDRDSNSGAVAWQRLLGGPGAAFDYFSQAVFSGSHLASMELVADGGADCAAVDGVSFAMIERSRPDLVARVRSIADSPESPGLPLITHIRNRGPTLERIRGALTSALADETLADCRQRQLLEGFTHLPETAYDFLAAFQPWPGS